MQAAKIKRYLAVPAQLGPLLLIAVFSVLFWVVTYAGLLGIPLAVLLFAGFCKYSFELLDSVSNGAEPPILSIEMMNPVGSGRSLVVLAVATSVFFGTGAASYWMGPATRMSVGLVALMILLAVIMVQGVTGSLLQAFDPRRSFWLVTRLRGDFVLIVACALGVFLAGCWAASWEFLPLIGQVALLMYGWLAIFALIGGVLKERRYDLGLDEIDELERVEPDSSRATERERDLQVDRLYGQWRSGAHKNAWLSVTRQLEESTDAIEELRWLYERVSRWPDRGLANRLAQEWVTRLLAAKRYGEMLNVVSEQLRVSLDFRPAVSAELVQVARIARDGGERRIARALLKDYERLYPGDAGREAVERLRRELEA